MKPYAGQKLSFKLGDSGVPIVETVGENFIGGTTRRLCRSYGKSLHSVCSQALELGHDLNLRLLALRHVGSISGKDPVFAQTG
jgi:hypothetical protein